MKHICGHTLFTFLYSFIMIYKFSEINILFTVTMIIIITININRAHFIITYNYRINQKLK